MFFEVIPTEIYRAGGGVLTYSCDQKLTAGQIVVVPLGKKSVLGIVYRQVPGVNFATKPISRILPLPPLPKHILKAIFWLSEYYLTPIPSVAAMFLPAGLLAGLKKSAKCDFANYPSEELFLSEKMISPQTDFTFDERLKRAQAERAEGDTRKDGLATGSLKGSEIVYEAITLNPAQKHALQALSDAPGTTKLLRGVTGSGKTNIYLQMAARTLQEGKSVVLLVPEIALTSQLVRIFEQTFGNLVTLIHSNQTMTERRKTWLSLLAATANFKSHSEQSQAFSNHELALGGRGSKSRPEQSEGFDFESAPTMRKSLNCSKNDLIRGRIIIGPRSALFAPLANLGLILIDESHESAYCQENSPRYSALRLASFIASTLKIPCIQGTATPNIVDFRLAKTRKSLVELTEKAKSTALAPETHVIDLKDRNNFTKNRYFSTQLLTAIEKNIQAKHQTLIFHNRRGSSPLTICEECGWQALCPECFLPMTLHTDGFLLTCHICGHEEKVPTSCPSCGHPGIIHKGFGTKLLESELARLFPNAKIARFDGDNDKKSSLAELYSDVKSGKIDLLIGTQTLARGLDLPLLATVGVVQADAGLSLPDFAAEERAFELLTQVIGRVGRGHLDRAEVIIQTYQPDHPVIKTALTADFPAFSEYLLKKRRMQALPPYAYLARLSVTYKTEKTTLKKIQSAHAELIKIPNLTVSPPTPAFHERTNQGFTWQIIVKSPSRETLRSSLAPFTKANFRLELDPPSLL